MKRARPMTMPMPWLKYFVFTSLLYSLFVRWRYDEKCNASICHGVSPPTVLKGLWLQAAPFIIVAAIKRTIYFYHYSRKTVPD